MRFPSELATNALDYRIDRPIVAAVRVNPPVLAHGLPVTIDALLLAPPGADARVTGVEICGLREDLIVDIGEDECFNEPELVARIGDEAPATWDPPDLSAITCPPVYGYGPYDSGGPWVPDTGADTDTGTPGWDTGPCASAVPLLVRAEADGQPFFGRVHAFVRQAPFTAGEPVPTPLWTLPRALTIVDGEAVAGGEVELEFRIASAIDDEGFRWWIDAGELVGTGRTAVHYVDGDWRITRNRLRIPDDWQGPLRVFVVTESHDSDTVPYTGDLAWELLTLDVR